jgi:predicted nucleic acid-binding protein
MAAFVDTNVLIYALVADQEKAADKVNKARELIAGLSRRKELVLSAQVLSEFSSNAMRKGDPPLTLSQTLTHIQQLSKQRVLPIDASLVQLALRRVEQSRISYWDALIVEAAIRSGASILYTEDMHHGTIYGALELRNPFLA